MTRVMLTGTRSGMTISQWAAFEQQVRAIFEAPGPHEWRDGDCIGADTQAHGTVAEHWPEVKTFGYPSNKHETRAYNEYDVTYQEHPPTERDRMMVDSSDIVFAAPHGFTEMFRGSGTWYTIRYARRVKKPLVMIWPDGSVTR